MTEIFDSAAYEDLQQQLQGNSEQISAALVLLKDHAARHDNESQRPRVRALQGVYQVSWL